jgi:hypothetical protein
LSGAVLAIPALLTADGPSVALQPAEVAGTQLHVVSIRDSCGQRRDRWFQDRAAALAHAVEQADGLGLLLLDLANQDAE